MNTNPTPRQAPATITRRSLLGAAALLAASHATPLGRVAPAPAAQERTLVASMSTLPPALFIGAHPDDETLAMGVSIAEHAVLGQDVHVLVLTRGTGSGVIGRLNGTRPTPSKWWGVMHDPAAEGYDPLTLEEFGAARIREATNAIRCLGPNITIHEGGLIDGQVTQSDAYAAILAVCDQIAPGGAVRLKSHTDIVDDHSDHLAVGAAVRKLGDDHPGRFDDRRYHILSRYWSDPRLSLVNQRWDTPGQPEYAARAINACRAYAAWSPPHTFAVGMHSTPALFKPLLKNPRVMYHK